jgi:hypothetical protein
LPVNRRMSRFGPIVRVAGLAATVAMLLAAAAAPAAAAAGDLVREFKVSPLPACGGTSQLWSPGIAFDGSELLLSCFYSQELTRVNPLTGAVTGSIKVTGLPAAAGISAIAWDGNRQRLWITAGNDTYRDQMGATIYTVTIDKEHATGTASPAFGPLRLGAYALGLAYDGSDDSVWLTFLQDTHRPTHPFGSAAWNYTTAGAQLGRFEPDDTSISTDGSPWCFMTGIVIADADSFYISNGVCMTLLSANKDLTGLSPFASNIGHRGVTPQYGLACDETTFGPETVVWMKGSSGYWLHAFEVPQGHCPQGGVIDRPPAVDAGPAASGPEGSEIALSGNASDPNPTDSLTTTWSYAPLAGVDPGASCSFADASHPATTVTCTDDGTYTLTLTADDGRQTRTASTTLTVTNANPQIGTLVLSGNTGTACIAGNTVSLSFPIADAGENDSQSGTIDWGDSSPAQSFSGRSFTGSHTYTAGTYTATVNASDDDDGLTSRTSGAAAIALLYHPVGFLEPLTSSDDRSVFQLGRTIPVKMEVHDCNDLSVSTVSPHIALARLEPAPETRVEDVASSGAGEDVATMRYEASGSAGKYIYNLSTKKSRVCSMCSDGNLTPGRYRVEVTNSTFSPITALLDLR